MRMHVLNDLSTVTGYRTLKPLPDE